MSEEKTLEQRIAALETELKEAKEAKAKAEKEPFKLKKPWPKYDPTEGMGMPASAVKAMIEAVPDMRGIAMEQRTVSGPGMLKPSQEPVKPRGSGWVEPTPLEPPSGIKYVDQMCDVQDAIDRRDLQRKLGK
jgi:hypothetical protein